MVMTNKRAERKARTKALMDAIHDTSDKRDNLIRKAVAAIDAQEVKYNTFEAELLDALTMGYSVDELVGGAYGEGDLRVTKRTRVAAVALAMINESEYKTQGLSEVTKISTATINKYKKEFNLVEVAKRYESKRYFTA